MGSEKVCLANRFIVGIWLIIFIFASDGHPRPALTMLPSETQDPAVEFAISEMKRLDIMWTRVFYAATESTYRFAAPIAMAGGGYILLQAPEMLVDLVSGGLTGGPLAGFAKLASGVAKDLILNIIEGIVKTPKQVCRVLVKDTIDEGWVEYKRAYEIARTYERTGSLTRAEALEFLACRYGPNKLTLAKTLRGKISTADYSIGQATAEKTTRDIIGHFSNAYQGKLGIEEKLPLTDAAFFIQDCMEILEAKKAGLAAYPPYLKFRQEMETIYRAILDEQSQYASRPSPGLKNLDTAQSKVITDGIRTTEKQAYPAIISADAEDFNAPLVETFESSALGGIPNGWTILNSGVSIATSSSRAYEGSKSVYLRGRPYGGANLVNSISTLNISSGTYRLTFFLFVDSGNWTGTDGVVQGHLEVAGKVCAIGVIKENGIYKIWVYGLPMAIWSSSAITDNWLKCEIYIDLDRNSAEYVLNGSILGGNAPASTMNERINLNAGAAGNGQGMPSAYFDFIKLEKIR